MSEAMALGPRAARAAWQTYWNVMRRYHRYEVRGLSHLTSLPQGQAALVAGYHGRPIAHDLCMLQALMLEETGRLPRAIIHTYFRTTPGLRWLYEGYDFLDGAPAEMDAAVARGDLVIVTPGGTMEGTRSSRDRYRVEWGQRVGYLRFAVKHRLPIIPAASWGVDDTYLALNDGYELGKRVGLPKGLPLWLGIGATGLWPLSPPLPVKITQLLGEPIDPASEGATDPSDRESLQRLHARVTGAVQALLDSRPGGPRSNQTDRLPTRPAGREATAA
jgi:1-acyl-sn-glycerol-3-phosphate acyltransferase